MTIADDEDTSARREDEDEDKRGGRAEGWGFNMDAQSRSIQSASKTEVCEDTELSHCFKLVYEESEPNGGSNLQQKFNEGNPKQSMEAHQGRVYQVRSRRFVRFGHMK